MLVRRFIDEIPSGATSTNVTSRAAIDGSVITAFNRREMPRERFLSPCGRVLTPPSVSRMKKSWPRNLHELVTTSFDAPGNFRSVSLIRRTNTAPVIAPNMSYAGVRAVHCGQPDGFVLEAPSRRIDDRVDASGFRYEQAFHHPVVLAVPRSAHRVR